MDFQGIKRDHGIGAGYTVGSKIPFSSVQGMGGTMLAFGMGSPNLAGLSRVFATTKNYVYCANGNNIVKLSRTDYVTVTLVYTPPTNYSICDAFVDEPNNILYATLWLTPNMYAYKINLSTGAVIASLSLTASNNVTQKFQTIISGNYLYLADLPASGTNFDIFRYDLSANTLLRSNTNNVMNTSAGHFPLLSVYNNELYHLDTGGFLVRRKSLPAMADLENFNLKDAAGTNIAVAILNLLVDPINGGFYWVMNSGGWKLCKADQITRRIIWSITAKASGSYNNTNFMPLGFFTDGHLLFGDNSDGATIFSKINKDTGATIAKFSTSIDYSPNWATPDYYGGFWSVIFKGTQATIGRFSDVIQV